MTFDDGSVVDMTLDIRTVFAITQGSGYASVSSDGSLVSVVAGGSGYGRIRISVSENPETLPGLLLPLAAVRFCRLGGEGSLFVTRAWFEKC